MFQFRQNLFTLLSRFFLKRTYWHQYKKSFFKFERHLIFQICIGYQIEFRIKYARCCKIKFGLYDRGITFFIQTLFYSLKLKEIYS